MTNPAETPAPWPCRFGFHRYGQMALGAAGGIYHQCGRCTGIFMTGWDGSRVLIGYEAPARSTLQSLKQVQGVDAT